MLKEIKKFWNFMWKEDTVLSWIAFLVFIFVVVKFVFFPFLSLILVTKLPLVVVESGSMHHPGSFIGNTIGLQNNFENWWTEQGKWYETKGINKENAESWPLKTGLEQGDIILVYGTSPEKLEIGDIIIFEADREHPIIHRIIDKKEINGEIYFSTKGDNNSDQLISEKNISENAILGQAMIKIPKLGWVKLTAVKLISSFS